VIVNEPDINVDRPVLAADCRLQTLHLQRRVSCIDYLKPKALVKINRAISFQNA
jgi:hypothetical protein